ncbi:c-type cytochrome [Parasphingorhabdus sp.]|uniref:c-type cytochrome n=1 Tax=Parasphingorhabdus sp. TaxID=2709688 RepID=UPI003A8F55EE
MAAGERAYQKCYSCHSLESPNANTQGPSLRQILGRPVASESGFDYSPAMQAFAQQQSNWTSGALNDFIADPEGLIPETEMGFVGIADASERHALIIYLSTK